MIDVCMTAWPRSRERLVYFGQTLDAFHANVQSPGPLAFHCSAETQEVSPYNRRELESLCERFAVSLRWSLPKPDLGAAMNRALAMGQADFQLMLQDDFALTEPLDLATSVQFLNDHPDFCAIRYEYVGSLRFLETTLGGLRIVDMQRNTWPFLDSPSLRRRSMVEEYGPYAEGLKHAAAEHRFGRTLNQGGAHIAASPTSLFTHIGEVPAAPGLVPLEA